MAGYSPTTWVNGGVPAINEDNLNKIEQGIEYALGFDSVANLAAEAIPTSVQSAYLRGVASCGDGGHGLFYWDSSNLSSEVTLDPGQGVYVAPTADATGASGAWVRQTDGTAVHAAWWGLTNDLAHTTYTGTDNTTAIQRAINWAAHHDHKFVLMPQGGYKFTNLYFHYDAVNNTGFPSGSSGDQANIVFRGAGRMTHINYATQQWRGTVMYSASSTGDAAIFADGDFNATDTYLGDNFRVEHMSVIVNNTTYAIKGSRTPQVSGMSDLYINQEGAGGGAEWETTWFLSIRDVVIRGAGKAVSLGYGLYVHNLDLSGGGVLIENLTSDRFATCNLIGHADRTGGVRLHSVILRNVQGGTGGIGIEFGGQLNVFDAEVMVEANDTGILFRNNPLNGRVSVSSASNGVDIKVGTGVVAEDYAQQIEITGQLIGSADPMIRIEGDPDIHDITIRDMLFNGDTTNVALSIEDAEANGIRVVNPRYLNVLTEVDYPDRLSFIQDYSRHDFQTKSSALARIPFQIRSTASNGAQPVALIYQGDVDVPFLEFGSTLTPGANYNHISTIPGDGSVIGPKAKSAANGWAFSKMMQVQINTAAGAQEVWIPLYTEDPL